MLGDFQNFFTDIFSNELTASKEGNLQFPHKSKNASRHVNVND